MIFVLRPLVVVFLVYLIIHVWLSMDEIGRRLDRDIPRLMDDPEMDPYKCRWSNYADYRICLTHGIREEQPYGVNT